MSKKKLTLAEKAKAHLAPETFAKQSAGTTTDPVGTPNNPSDKVFTVANLITLCRLILTIVFLHIFASHGNRIVGLVCYAIACVTDFLDGQVARRTQTVSWVGKIADPVMDRVLLFAGVLGLVIAGDIPVWIAVFIIGRDAYLAAGIIYLQRFRKRPVDVIFSGKVATAFLMFGFVDLLVNFPVLPGLGWVTVSWLPGLNSTPMAPGIYCVYIGIIFSTITAISYTKIGIGIRNEVLAEKKDQKNQ